MRPAVGSARRWTYRPAGSEAMNGHRRTSGFSPRRFWLGAVVAMALPWPSLECQAGRAEPTTSVVAPFVEMHSGPGRGYPVFHTVERGGSLALIKRRTDWVKVRAPDGTEGWVRESDVIRNTADGRSYTGRDAVMEDYLSRRVEAGFATGDFDGDRSFTVRAGYRLNEFFLAEAGLTEVSGSFSSTRLYHADLLVQPFSRWRVSPFFSLGTGRFRNDPKKVLVDDQKVDAWAANAALGVRGYVSRRMLLRGEYRRYVVMTDEDGNDEFGAWSLGFSVFF